MVLALYAFLGTDAHITRASRIASWDKDPLWKVLNLS